MINIAVCDDDQIFLGEVEALLNRYSTAKRAEFAVELYSSGEEFVKDLQAGKTFELLFLDIEMELMNGVETAEWVRTCNNRMLIVFVSSHEEYMKRLFEVEPFRFLQKPLDPGTFFSVLDKATARIERLQSSYFVFHSGKSVVKTPVRDILYFESDRRKIVVHLENRQYEFYDKLDEVEKQLQNQKFLRIHKSFLVNIDNVESFQYERVALRDGTILNISEKNRSRVLSEFWKVYKKGEEVHE